MNLSIQNWLGEHNIEISLLQELPPGQMAGLAFRIIQEMEAKSLSPFDICSLAEVLEQPLDNVRGKIQVIAQLTAHLLHALSRIKPLQRNEGTWLAFQIAYLHGLQQVLEQEAYLHKGWLNRTIIPYTNSSIVSKLGFPNPRLQALLNTIRPGKLTDTQAEQALSLIADSLLVQQMNNATIAWLVANGTEEVEAKLIIQRLVHGLPGYLLSVIIDLPAPLAQLQKFVRLGSAFSPSPEKLAETKPPDSQVNDKIDVYLEQYRVSLLTSRSQPLFLESFALEDIYIPHKGTPVGVTSLPVDLITWVQEQLGDQEKMTVIESPSGYGKTCFCQKLAAKFAWKLYPQWIPVFIRLRDITYSHSLIDTLVSGIDSKFALSLANILKQNHLRLLLILDGLDELPPCTQGTMVQKILLQQLLQLQSQGKHQVVLTSSSKVLRELYPEILPKLQRIEIKPWEQDEWRQWFQYWTNVQSLSVAQNYFTFLKKLEVFKSSSPLSHLVRQPLMLYLLGILHRDGLWNRENLPSTYKEKTSHISLLWEIYQSLNRWLMGYSPTGEVRTVLWRAGSAHIHRTSEAIANLLQGREAADVLKAMQAIALKILHSQRHYIIESTANTHPLPNFYLIKTNLTVGEDCVRLEFSHPHLGELICADAIANQLQILTQTQKHTYSHESFVIDSIDAVAHHLYQLLGYGILGEDIEALVWEKLRREDKQAFSWQTLGDRLQSFWFDYCSGYWLEIGIANQHLNYFRSLNNPITIEQINAAVGMNVFLLLCGIYRHLETSFSPCGNPDNPSQFYPQALTMLIARSSVLSPHAFIQRTAKQSLISLNLQGSYLSQINLTGANLTDANLTDANLIGANLTGANLTNTNLTNADLTGANLTKVQLDSTSLHNTRLADAIMDNADKELASSKGAIFLSEQLQMLHYADEQQPMLMRNESWVNTDMLSLYNSDYGIIEVAEGEPMLPLDIEQKETTEFNHEFNPDYDQTEFNQEFHDIQTHI